MWFFLGLSCGFRFCFEQFGCRCHHHDYVQVPLTTCPSHPTQPWGTVLLKLQKILCGKKSVSVFEQACTWRGNLYMTTLEYWGIERDGEFLVGWGCGQVIHSSTGPWEDFQPHFVSHQWFCKIPSG
jgi:hypothetical protein